MRLDKMILMTVLLGFSATSMAGQVTKMNDKVTELELEQEVETLESYGEAAAAKQAEEESVAMQEEARRLERSIRKMEKQNKRNTKRQKILATKYQHKARLAAKVKARYDKTLNKKNNLDDKVFRLQSRVDQSEQEAINAIDGRKNAERELAKLERVYKSLQKRERVAQRVIRQNNARERRAIARGRKLHKKRKSLEKRVDNLENEAGL